MLSISRLNPDLTRILTEFSDFFYGRDFSHLEPLIGSNEKMRNVSVKSLAHEAVSETYLREALKQPPIKHGFPRHSWGLELVMDRRYIEDKELLDKAAAANSKLMNFFGARNNALQMFYPAGGYIGWHNNCNAPGYNIVLSCNPEAKGYFEHYDHVNDKFVRFDDAAGWNCKVGYFGSDKEDKKIYWHCAYTDSPRLTFSYVIYDKNIWADMVDDIGTPD
jgi:hypothetical protein